MFRLLEISYSCKDIEKVLEKFNVEIWKEKHGKKCIAKVLVNAEESEDVLNALQKSFSKDENFRIVIIPVEATIPREEKEEEKEERVATEEIYEELMEKSKLTYSYLALVILAAITASIGILYNNIAIVIGSMVIAPLLSPNMALALAAMLADSKLAKHAIITSICGYASAIFVGIVFGVLFHTEINAHHLSHVYILLSFSAGIAGAISIMKGSNEALIGVMVAVALLPPIVEGGILLGQNRIIASLSSLLIFSINVVGINLAAILTFLAHGISPRTWWMKRKAKRTIWISILIWLSILLVLIALIYFYERI